MGQIRTLFVYFRPFLITMTNIVQLTLYGKSVDGVLGIRTRDRMMEGADDCNEPHNLPQTFTILMDLFQVLDPDRTRTNPTQIATTR